MNVHEYQGKEILRKYGVATPRGIPCFSVTEAEDASRKLGGKAWVVKAQIHAGGRGKGGGVKVAKSLEEVHEYASKILGMTLVTHQTGPEGRLVRRFHAALCRPRERPYRRKNTGRGGLNPELAWRRSAAIVPRIPPFPATGRP